jgi:hypothetical protein
MDTPFDPVMSRIRYWHVREPIPVSDADIQSFEEELGYALPASYRLFLKKYGLTAGKGDTRFSNPDNRGEIETSVDVFYGFKPGDTYDIRENWESYADELPGQLLPIATGSGGQFLLSLAGEDKGTVYWWLPEYGPVASRDNIEPVADSFDRFVNSLVSVEE